MSVKSKLLLTCFALFTVLGLSACNTVEGVGEDLQDGGRAVENAANSNR